MPLAHRNRVPTRLNRSIFRVLDYYFVCVKLTVAVTVKSLLENTTATKHQTVM